MNRLPARRHCPRSKDQLAAIDRLVRGRRSEKSFDPFDPHSVLLLGKSIAQRGYPSGRTGASRGGIDREHAADVLE